MNERLGRLTELLVDAAINIAAIKGIAAGARARAELEVPLELAHRVLLHPSHRRIHIPHTRSCDPANM